MARMVPLKVYRDKSLGFPDLLNWGTVIADGVVLNKDGSLLAGWFYRGKDLATVSAVERNHVSSVVSGALSKLGSGWMLHQDALRKPARDYPGEVENAFPEAVSALIEAERRAGGPEKPLDVTVKATVKSGGAPSPAALAYAGKIARASGGEIPPEILADRNRLSQWIGQNKPDEPSAKQTAFARSLAERKRIAIEPAVLRSRAALSAWISAHA